MSDAIIKMKFEIAKLEDERVKAERYYYNRINELKHQIKKELNERNRRLSEED